MAAKLFLNEQELRSLGMGEPNITTLRKLVAQANVQAQIDAANDDINANAASISELAANDVAIDGRLDNVENDIGNLQVADTLLVTKNAAVAPTYTPYAGQTVSVLYTQAEAQTTDDAVKALSVAVSAILTALQAADVLS